MSDTEKPDIPPAPAEAAEPTARPEPKSGRPPSLDHEQLYGSGPRLKDLDAEIERELQEALGGLEAKDIYTDEPARQRGPQPAAAEPGRKKGKVISVHGADVFVDVPGGRSQ